MLMRYWQAALLAAVMALAAIPARGEDPSCAGTCGNCCKEKSCCKSKACCQGKDCCPSVTCCKGYCCTAKECCCKDDCKCKDSCKCGKKCCTSKECCKGKCGADCGCCCTAKSKSVKHRRVVTPIIVIVPMPSSALPVYGSMDPAAMMHFHPQNVGFGTGCGGMTLPPMLTPPGLPQPPMPPQTVGLPVALVPA